MRRHSSRFSTRKTKGKILLILFLLLLAAGGIAWYLFFEKELPQATIETDTYYFGKNSVFEIKAEDQKSGIKSINIIAAQGDKNEVLYHKENPRTGYRSPVGPLKETAKIAIDTEKLGFSEGPLELILEVTDFSLQRWFQGNKTVVKKELIVDTQAPKIHILHTEQAVSSGGAGIAIYQLDDKETVTGVQLDGYFNRAYPVTPENTNTYIAYYGIPYDSKNISELSITATDKAGNTTTVPMAVNLLVSNYQRDTINISDNFLNQKIPEFQQYYPEIPGNMLEKYLYINNTIREKNAAIIKEVCQTSSPNKLWNGDFARMAGSKRAGYADQRSYHYKGEVIDHQTHLGIDIASVRRDNVKAANSGIVVYADYLGIYGNMVIVDHGQGVFSLYSHLSQIDVTPGTQVTKGDLLGLTGTTGMAGGDHLHFSMLIHGLYVTPREWWDRNWVRLNIEEPIENLRLHKTNAQ